MTEATQESPALCVRGEFNIFTASTLKDELLNTIGSAPEDSEFDIDLSDVTDIDTTGIQLMLMAKREAAAQDKNLRFVRHSDAVLDLIDLCDLAGQLGDPVLIRSQS